MSKVMLGAYVTRALTSPGLRDLRRQGAAWRRRLRGETPALLFFYQPDDPYSHLAALALPRLLERYGVEIRLHLVRPPEDAAAPDRARLAGWSLRDAGLIAPFHGLAFPAEARAQDRARTQALAACVAGLCGGALTAEQANALGALGAAYWQGAALPEAPTGNTEAALAAGTALRFRLGHYLGGMFYFEGEWYWAVDRLHHLHARLHGAGLDRMPTAPAPFPCHDVSAPLPVPPQAQAARPVLHFFASLRSPYTYIATPRVRALARAYGAELRLRPVLPMVMRGLAVPGPKRIYIALDTKREAERLGLPFGFIADPVGRGAECGLAVLHHAIDAGLGEAFLESFLRGVFAEGIDAATEAGLLRIAQRAGMDGKAVAAALADPGWKARVEANRQEMLEMGLWGVPSFRVDGCGGYWGQDRLFLVERDLKG